MPAFRSLAVGLMTFLTFSFDAAAPQRTDAGPADLRVLQAERSALETRIELFRRTMPPEFDFDSETRYEREAAKKAEVELSVDPVAGSESVATAGGTAPFRLHRLRYRGTGSLGAIQRWLELVSLHDWRMRDLEVLTLAPAGGGNLRFIAEFIYPVWPPATTAPATRRDPIADLRAEVVRDRAIEATLADLSMRTLDGRLARAAALLDAWAESELLRVARLTFSDRLEIKGAVAGATARASLLDAIRGAKFGIERLTMPRRGACRPFTLVARPGIPDAATEYAENGIDRELGALCGAVGPTVSTRVTARGTGPISVHLRRVQVADAAFVLNDLTEQSFVVDHDVDSWIDVDLESVTLDEALKAFRGAGLFVGPPPLRRISKVERPTPAQTWNGEHVSLILRDVSLSQVLCIFQELTSLEMKMPADTRARIAVFAADIPWDQALDGVIASSDLSYALDGSKMFVGPQAVVANAASRPQTPACEVNAPDDGVMRPLLAAAQLDSTDIVLAGTAATADGWRGYTRMLWPPLTRIDTGTKLVDSTVTSIERDGVTLKMKNGESRTLAVDR